MLTERKLQKFKKTVKDLAIASNELNSVRDELRKSTEKLSGCDLSDWSIDDLCKYINLGYTQYIILPKLRRTIKLTQDLVKAIESVHEKKG